MAAAAERPAPPTPPRSCIHGCDLPESHPSRVDRLSADSPCPRLASSSSCWPAQARERSARHWHALPRGTEALPGWHRSHAPRPAQLCVARIGVGSRHGHSPRTNYWSPVLLLPWDFTSEFPKVPELTLPHTEERGPHPVATPT